MQQTAGLFQRRTALANLPTPVRSPRGGIYLEPRSRLTAFCRGFLFVGNGCQASIGQQNAYEKSRPRDLGSEDYDKHPPVEHRSKDAARRRQEEQYQLKFSPVHHRTYIMASYAAKENNV